MARRQKSMSSAEQHAEHEENAARSRQSREQLLLLLQEISGVSSKAVITGSPPCPHPFNRSMILLTKSIRNRGNPPTKSGLKLLSQFDCRARPRPHAPLTAKKACGFLPAFCPTLLTVLIIVVSSFIETDHE